MKQVLQYAGTGEVEVIDVPAPKLLPGCALVRIAASVVSAGTERASSEFARKNLLQKAHARPDVVRDVIGKVRRDGFASAFAAVRSRLDQPVALGYSSAGTVVEVGEGVTDIEVGDRVACAGAGYAVHAECACIPRLLLTKIPASHVTFQNAAFTTMGAVALHGVRTADAKLGDVIAVVGLGLLGQLTVQILKAAGCHVVGMDVVAERVALACRLGADASSMSPSEFRDLCLQQSGGRGVDAILITAQTSTSGPVNFAAEIARDRAVVVAVGAVGMDIQRKLFYEKELDFRMSRSYGPGRYDSAYEQKGIDYPIGYVRWTETRNMDAFLRLLADRKLDTEALVTHRFAIERAHCAYDLISGRTGQPFLGVLITYPEDSDEKRVVELVKKSVTPASIAVKSLSIGLLGAGGFAMSTLLPALKKVDGLNLVGVCSATGPHALHAAAKFGFRYCATNEESILNDAAIATVVIATRHHLHASQVIAALRAGKHVFCEKPLCLREEELLTIIRAYKDERLRTKPLLMIGFNRRFAPLALRMKAFLRQVHEPLALHYRVNAGYIPLDHWVNDPGRGGGRILGEVCHFIDFLSFLVGAPPVQVETRSLTNPGKYSADNVVISLYFPEGSQGTVTYVANGDSSYSKERVEVFGGGAVAALEDFRRLELVRHGRRQLFRSLRQDKGHWAEWRAFAKAIRTSEESPIPFDDIVATTLATLRAEESRSAAKCVFVDATHFIASASPN